MGNCRSHIFKAQEGSLLKNESNWFYVGLFDYTWHRKILSITAFPWWIYQGLSKLIYFKECQNMKIYSKNQMKDQSRGRGHRERKNTGDGEKKQKEKQGRQTGAGGEEEKRQREKEMRSGCREKEPEGRGWQEYRECERAEARQKRKKLSKNILSTLKEFHFLAFRKENMATTVEVDMPYLLSLLKE